MALEAIVGGTVATILDTLCLAGSTLAGLPPVKEWLSGCHTRLVRGRMQPGNHDLVRGIRTAHLCASDVVARRHSKMIATLPDRDIGSDEETFASNLRSFLDKRLRALTSSGIDHDVLTIEDIDHVLDHLVHPATTEGYAACAKIARDQAVARALEEIETDAGRSAPPLFRRLFEGDGGAGWYDAFALYVTEELKTNERFRSIFLTAELFDIKTAVKALNVRLEKAIGLFPDIANFIVDVRDRSTRLQNEVSAIRSQQSSDSAKLEELLALARAGGVFERASNEGIREEAVRRVVVKLGGEDIVRDNLLPWLDNWIDAARNELGKRTNEDKAFEAARLVAERLFKAGRANASAALMDEYDREKRAEAERQEDRKRRSIVLLETAIRYDELQLDGEGVVAKLRELAAVEGRTGSDAVGGYLHEHALAFYERGDQEGDNTALLMALAVWRATLDEWARDRVPLNWALIQNNVGIALAALGERESVTTRLEQAVTAHRLALEELKRDQVPLDWAITQHNLGGALAKLGQRQSHTALLEEAVAAWQAALQERTRDRVPLEWAMTQTSLGVALVELGKRESGTKRLKQAVEAYQAALKEFLRGSVPLLWATVQTNLGIALCILGIRESKTVRLEQAVAAHRAALEERTRARVPLDWAMSQHNLGIVLLTLGERESGTVRLQEAIAAFRAALGERTRDRVPLDWASTQSNLGAALQRLGERESGTARLEEAVTAYRTALEEVTRERVPLEWAMMQNNLATALHTRGKRETGTARLEEAIAAYRAALLEFTQDQAPWYREQTMANLDLALRMLKKRQS